MRNTTITKVPFSTRTGALLEEYRRYHRGYWPREEPEWRDNVPFDATMTLESAWQGHFTWRDEDGRQWPMFSSEVEKLVKNATITGGVVRAQWMVSKRGYKYSLSYEGPAAD